MSLRAKRLTAQQAGDLWADFYEAYGPEVMEQAYGWESPTSRQIRKGERVWAFHDTAPTPIASIMDQIAEPGGIAFTEYEARVGWGACYLSLDDPDDIEAVLVVGVFPDFRGRGYRLAILDWMAAWAKKRGAKYARIIVFAENEANHQRHHDEADRGPWIWAGDVWYPDPYSIFVRALTEEEAAA